MKSKRSHSRSVSPKERDVSNGDLPSPSKKIKWAESASPSPERAVRGLQHDIENATQITPELEDAQQTNVGAPARATTPIEHTTPGSEAHRARLLMENKKGAEELVAQYQMQEALVQCNDSPPLCHVHADLYQPSVNLRRTWSPSPEQSPPFLEESD